MVSYMFYEFYLYWLEICTWDVRGILKSCINTIIINCVNLCTYPENKRNKVVFKYLLYSIPWVNENQT